MTKEQKIEWLRNASNEEVINQMRWAVTAMTKAESIEMQIEAQEDYELVIGELKSRMQ